jgi:CHASE3 domain sensor protein
MRPREARVRRTLPLFLIVIASLLAVVAIFAIWANRQLLNNENSTESSSQLTENRPIRNQVALLLVDDLHSNVDAGAAPP